jgi:hypothetical protein
VPLFVMTRLVRIGANRAAVVAVTSCRAVLKPGAGVDGGPSPGMTTALRVPPVRSIGAYADKPGHDGWGTSVVSATALICLTLAEMCECRRDKPGHDGKMARRIRLN